MNLTKEQKQPSRYKDVLELNGHYYTVHLSVNDETGDVIAAETWVEKS